MYACVVGRCRDSKELRACEHSEDDHENEQKTADGATNAAAFDSSTVLRQVVRFGGGKRPRGVGIKLAKHLTPMNVRNLAVDFPGQLCIQLLRTCHLEGDALCFAAMPPREQRAVQRLRKHFSHTRAADGAACYLIALCDLNAVAGSPVVKPPRPSECDDVIRRAHVSRSRGATASISVLEQILGC